MQESKVIDLPTATYNCTDLGNGERFARKNKEAVRYCHPMRKWIVWDGCRWRPDDLGKAKRLAKNTIKNIYVHAGITKDKNKREALASWAMKSESNFRIKAMLEMAQSEPGIPILPEELDRDKWLLNVENGTIDLKTGDIRDHQKSDMITKLSPVAYDENARCPSWYQFLETILNYNSELIEYLKRASGYSVTGSTSEQCLFFLYGTGANGKSTFLNVLQSILGDYALQTGFDTLIVKKNEGIRNDIARLNKARLVCAVETSDTTRFNEPVVKQLTGGDRVAARFLHREYFEFVPEFKLWLAANYKPAIYGQDHAIWRRIRLIPFTESIPPDRQDQHLTEKLLEEKSGILNWIIEGCNEWQECGLSEPDEVKAATEDYKSEMDILGDFIESECIQGDDFRILHTELYNAYTNWCLENDESPVKKHTFSKKIEGRGFIYQKPKNRKKWIGIALKSDVVG